MSDQLHGRIEAETGITVLQAKDQYKLSGIFNRYRPDGAGIERLFGGSGIETNVLSRLRNVFLASGSSWKPGDLYFIIRQHKSIDPRSAVTIVERYLANFRAFAEHIGDSEAAGALKNLTVQTGIPAGVDDDEDPSLLMYECLTNFLAKQQPDKHELFWLKEALHSIANDYFLMAYILWPAIRLDGQSSHAIDDYLEVWRCGITLKFFDKGIVVVGLPRLDSNRSSLVWNGCPCRMPQLLEDPAAPSAWAMARSFADTSSLRSASSKRS